MTTDTTVVTHHASAPARRVRAHPGEGPGGPVDLAILGSAEQPAAGRGSRSGSPAAASPAEAKGPETTTLPGWVRGVSLGLAGTIGLLSLSGCSRPPAPPPTSTTTTQQDSEARQALSKAFQEAEQAINQSKTGDGKDQAQDATRKLIGAVSDYARKTGRTAQQVAGDLREYMIEHPAVTITVAYAVGVGAGIGLEKLGLSEHLDKGLQAIGQAVKDHPIIAGVVAAAAVGAVVYLIYDAATAESQNIPPAPQTPEAQKLKAEFDALEKRAESSHGNSQQEAREIDRTLKEKIGDYARATGRTASEVAQDIKQFYVEHPGVSVAVVMAAGVGTGVLLERAGVPAQVAHAAQVALESSRDGLAGATRAIKEHPVLATAIGVGIAAGAGYVIYETMSK